jgi:quercetin dioxygenase-like cupin family protein
MKQLKLSLARTATNVHKTLALVVLGAVAAVAAAAALATPPSGVIANTIFARGTLAPHFKIKLRDSSSPGDVAVQQAIIAPGGTSGWHAHPGAAIVIVKSGEFTIDQADDCSTATYGPGQVVVEPTGHVHRARNVGTTNTEIWVVYLDLPVGASQRIEASDPGC